MKHPPIRFVNAPRSACSRPGFGTSLCGQTKGPSA
jgi:hypothetical protein